MKKGTISIIILIIFFILLIVLGVFAYNKLYVPKDFVFRIQNTVSQNANVVYIYENGNVILNNGGINKYRYKMKKEDIEDLKKLLPECEFSTRVYVVTTQDGKETNVANKFYLEVSEKLGIKDVFTEGIE